MAINWPEHRLIDLYDIRSGLSKPRSDFGYGYGFLTFKDVLDNVFVPEHLTGLVNSSERERELCSVQRGDVFLTRTSETMEDLGMSCVALQNYPDATFNGFTKRLRPKTSLVVPEYAAYYFRGAGFRQAVTAMSSLSTRASLNNEMIGRLTIHLPPFPVQQHIGSILKTLDDKIELNRRMNETLEAMARRLFKSWFVDFDPVHAKAALRRECPTLSNVELSRRALPKMAPEVAELFPDSFEDSPLGRIPKGWRAGTVPDAIDVNPTRSLPKGTVAPWLEMSNMPTTSARAVSWEYRAFGSGTKFINGDTLVARITPCLENGKTAFVDFLREGEVGAGSTEYIVLSPKPPLPPIFAYLLARTDDFRQHVITNMTGTSGRQRAPAECLDKLSLVMPTAQIATCFGKATNHFFVQMKQIDEESAVLVTTRDKLLPKLLSGDLPVADRIIAIDE